MAGSRLTIRVVENDLVLAGALTGLQRRFERHVLRDPDPDGCWLWTGKLRDDGYGQLQVVKGITWRAHRVSYLLTHGEMPSSELVLDHLCRVRSCVNPSHLEPVTQDENKRRGAAARSSTCLHGHARTEKNTYRKGKHVECRVCHRDRERVRKARLR